ncbi:MAG: hypothetical protein WAR57_14300 [Candidatus Phosphoribacter sp.]
MSRSRLKLAQRAGWNLANQLLSAMSNVVLAIVVARTQDAQAFGAFSVSFLVFGIAVAVERALVGQPLQILHSADSPDSFRRAATQGLTAVLGIGVIASFTTATAGALIGAEVGQVLYVTAVVLPALVLQDACRMAFFAMRDPRSATSLDLLWTVALFVGVAVLLYDGQGSVSALVLVWGASAALSALIGFLLLGAWPRPRTARGWLRRRGRLSGYLLAEYVVGLGTVQIGILLTGVIAGAEDVGSLRGGQVILGPLGILGAAAFAFALPELAKRTGMVPRRLGLAGLALSGVLGAAATVYLLAILLMPSEWGRSLFADTWDGSSVVLPLIGLVTLAASIGAGPGVVLYSLGRADLTFRLHLVKAPLLVVLIVVGAQASGAHGAAIALAICEVALLPAWFWVAYRVLKQSSPDDRKADMAAGVRTSPGTPTPRLFGPWLRRPARHPGGGVEGPARGTIDPVLEGS